MNNFIINTNCESIKDSDGRRIAILEISHNRLGDHAYFHDLRQSCFNNTVGEAFYSYLLTKVDVTGFYGQKEFPETDKKKTAIANLLPIVHEYLKFEFFLKHLPVSKIATGSFYNNFTIYCTSIGINKPIGRNDFYDKLVEIGIGRSTKNNGIYYYNVSVEKLQELSVKYKWICAYDDEDVIVLPTMRSPLDFGVKLSEPIDYESKYEELLSKFAELQASILQAPKPIIIIEPAIEPVIECPQVVIVDDDTISVLTECFDEPILIYSSLHKTECEKLEQIKKNIKIINKKLAKYIDTETLEELNTQSELVEKLNKNKNRWINVTQTLPKDIRIIFNNFYKF